MTPKIEKIERLHLMLLCGGAVVGWLSGVLHVPSFLLGGGVMQINFFLLKKIVGLLLFHHSDVAQPGKKRAIVWIAAKGLVFLGLLSALFIRYPIQPVSFSVGVSLLLVTVVILSLGGSRQVVPDAATER